MKFFESNITVETFLNEPLFIRLPDSMLESKKNLVEGEGLSIKNHRQLLESIREESTFTIREVEKMMKEQSFLFNQFKETDKSVKSHFNGYYQKEYFQGRTIGIVDGDFKGLMQSLFCIDGFNQYKHLICYSMKNEKTNEFYVLEKKMNIEGKIYLTGEELFSMYQQDKEELYALSLIQSLENYSESNYQFKYHTNNHLDSAHDKDGLAILRKMYPFYHKKINDIFTNERSVNKLNLNYLFYEDYLMPFLRVFDLDYYYNSSLGCVFTEEDLQKIIKSKSELEMFKVMFPYGNKETRQLLNHVVNADNDLGGFEPREYCSLESLNLNILSVFENTQRLNEFIANIHSNNCDYSSLTLYKDSVQELSFYKDMLLTFFHSKEHYERSLVKKLKELMQSVEKDLEQQSINFNIGLEQLECTCGEEFDDILCECEADYYSENELSGDNNYLQLQELLEDTFKSYHVIQKEYPNQSDKMKKEIDIILNKKYKDIEDIHNIFADVVTKLTTTKYDFELPSTIKVPHLEKDDLELFFVQDNFMLKQVGREMHHCVASYEDSIISKQTSIFVVRHNTKFVACLEVENSKNAIIQAKGRYNARISEKDYLQLIKTFVEKNQFNIYTNDIMFEKKQTI